MPNWCSTAYAIEGDAQEIKKLYELMKNLQERKEPSVENGFGTSWLGCLVDALGEDWNKVSCRGDWANLEIEDETLRFTTETAWGPCNETLDLVCEKFPSLRYYYRRKSRAWAFTRPMTAKADISQTSSVPRYILSKMSIIANTLPIGKPCSSGWKKSSGNP